MSIDAQRGNTAPSQITEPVSAVSTGAPESLSQNIFKNMLEKHIRGRMGVFFVCGFSVFCFFLCFVFCLFLKMNLYSY